MHGTFNGIRLDRIISAGTQEIENSTLTILRGLDPPVPQLLKELRKDAPVLLILSDKEIEGVILSFTADAHWYQITIESNKSSAV
jgi:hypothetical protein